MTKIIPGIYQLQIPIPNNTLRHTNIYLVQGDDKYVLIDAGWNSEEALQSVKEQLAELRLDFKDIHRIIVTHAHSDHYGLAGTLRQLSQAGITIHHLEKNLIAHRYLNTDGFLQQTEQLLHINGVSADELPILQTASLASAQSVFPALPDITLHGGEIISTGVFNFQVLWTPGHSPGHICLYEPTQKILFSGDHILPVITPNISLLPQSGTNPLGDFINSLNMVKQLDVNLVLPAHEHLFTDLQTRVEEIIQHHEQRKSEILATIKVNPKTAYKISAEITWMPGMDGVNWQNLTPRDKRLAVLETLAHLESMRIDERVDKLFRDTTIYYCHT